MFRKSAVKFIIAVVVVLLFLSLGLNVAQQERIQTLQVGISQCQVILSVNRDVSRAKREISEPLPLKTGKTSMYLPLFTQITQKQIDDLCANRYDTVGIEKHSEPLDVVFLPAEATKTKPAESVPRPKDRNRTKWRNRQRKENNTCALISNLGTPRKYGERLYDLGSAVRSGELFYITEYSMGYMLFEYNTTGVDASELLRVPSNIYTLPMPFFGTDHTVNRHRNFYYHVPSTEIIIRYDPVSDKMIQHELPLLEQKPLYIHSASWVDLEYDQGYLYAIFKEVNNTAFTVRKLHGDNMKKADSYQVVIHHPESLINSFVSCGVLYAVRMDGINENAPQNMKSHVRIEAVFDFKMNAYLNDSHRRNDSDDALWLPEHIPANIQFDAVSKSLTAFDKGKIFSVPVIPRKHKL
uniref:Olfactomedin-like domain-containing protein n=1 Tax=Panagrellus redivivus TaxID=6233 RepID=A0A7E4ZU27_PANRE